MVDLAAKRDVDIQYISVNQKPLSEQRRIRRPLGSKVAYTGDTALTALSFMTYRSRLCESGGISPHRSRHDTIHNTWLVSDKTKSNLEVITIVQDTINGCFSTSVVTSDDSAEFQIWSHTESKHSLP